MWVVIAAFNEAPSIAGVVRAVPDDVCGLATHVLVVDDGSADRTADAARAAGAEVLSLGANGGQGVALRAGYRAAAAAGARYVATLDADGQYDPLELALVVQPLLDGAADFVTGSRRLGRRLTTDRVRAAGVVVFSKIISVLGRSPVTDPANGLRAMRIEVVEAVPLRQPQYQASELLLGAMLLGFRVAEVPTTMRPRAAGETKKGGNLLYGVRFAGVIASTWWSARKMAVS